MQLLSSPTLCGRIFTKFIIQFTLKAVFKNKNVIIFAMSDPKYLSPYSYFFSIEII